MKTQHEQETGKDPKKVDKHEEARQDELFPGYPQYPSSEDVFNEHLVDSSDDPKNRQAPNPSNEKVMPAGDQHELDVPGSELDDSNEEIGEEDEENNYYSLGGDNHKDLEDNQGELFESDTNQ